jgi:type I restriction enzyme R subunit
MNEAETRAEHIDPMLLAAGWGTVPGSRIRREYLITLGRLEGNGKRGNALSADYVLEYRNTKLAVIEAKAWDKPLTSGVAQAKDYASKLTLRYAYSSNGQGIYAIDMETGKEETVFSFPTPDELWQATFMQQNQWWDRFTAVPFEDKGGYWQGRYYQDIAIERVLRALAEGQDRILLTLAGSYSIVAGTSMIGNKRENQLAVHVFYFWLIAISLLTKRSTTFLPSLKML